MLRAAQFRQLQGLLQHAAATVPFYGKRLAENGINVDAPLDEEMWSRIPLLTRRDVQSAGDALLSSAVPMSHGRGDTITTSGSTGTPVTVQTTQTSQFFLRCFTLRSSIWHRFDVKRKFTAIRHNNGPGGEYPNGIEMRSWGGPFDALFVTGPSALLSIMTPVPQQIEWLQRQKPDYFLTYPSNLAALLAYCRENGIRFPKLRAVATMGEILSPYVRRACREIWGVKVLDMYTCQEVGYLALQCPEHEHHHVQSENILLEVLDENDQPCAPGETGRVVITALHNFATPLIRYANGDYAVVGEACPCGRGLPVLKRILGRMRNMMTLPTGEQLWPYFGSDKLRAAAPLRQFQLVQKSLTELEVHLVVERPFTSEDEGRVRSVITGEIGDVFNIVFIYHETIPRGPGGKYEDFRSEIAHRRARRPPD